jgi:hypothetical protein
VRGSSTYVVGIAAATEIHVEFRSGLGMLQKAAQKIDARILLFEQLVTEPVSQCQ